MFSGKGFHYNRTLTILCNVCMLSHVRLFVTPWTVAHQAPLSMGFSRQEYWSGLPFPSPGIFPTQGLNPHLQHWQVNSLPLHHLGRLSDNEELPWSVENEDKTFPTAMQA